MSKGPFFIFYLAFMLCVSCSKSSNDGSQKSNTDEATSQSENIDILPDEQAMVDSLLHMYNFIRDSGVEDGNNWVEKHFSDNALKSLDAKSSNKSERWVYVLGFDSESHRIPRLESVNPVERNGKKVYEVRLEIAELTSCVIRTIYYECTLQDGHFFVTSMEWGADVKQKEMTYELPVSKAQLIKDCMNDYDDEYLDMFNLYQVMDLGNGYKAVLLFGEDSASPSAILTYLNGKLVDHDFARDGYNTFSIGKDGKGVVWFADEFDNHGGDYREWHTSYYKIQKGKLVGVGGASVNRNGIAEDGEDYNYEESRDLPKNCKLPEFVTFYDMAGWAKIDFSDVNGSADDADSSCRKMVGKLDGKYEVTLFITDEDTGEGYYYYNNRPSSTFTLTCTEGDASSNSTSHVVLEEHNAAGKHTGTFDGQMNPDGYTGVFTNYKGQTFRFELEVE